VSDLRAHLADYVELRRSLGFACREADSLLPNFLAYLDRRGARHVTADLALAWATSPSDVLAITKRQRLGAVRGFAEYLHAIDDRTEVPPTDLLPATYTRVAPYFYSDEEIEALMAAARTLKPALRAITYETLIGLVAVSGIRVGEAIRLDRDDIDYQRALLVVRASKRVRSREVPLHDSTLHALSAYSKMRDHRWRELPLESFFVSTVGTPLYARCVDKTHRDLVARAGLDEHGQRRRPRLHDLRHSFAIKTLIGWHRDGLDIDARIPALCRVLGHANPANTYWYLQAVPELLAIVAERVEHIFGDQT
jgi:integrase